MDIQKGRRWVIELGNSLDEINFGILCLTPENLASPWIHFEAGAIGKSLIESSIFPILFGLGTSDVAGPLAQFQLTKFTREDMVSLIEAINSKLETPLDGIRLNTMLTTFWPQLETKIDEIMAAEPLEAPVRSERELIEELLTLNRNQQRRISERFDPGSNWRLALRGPGNSSFDFDELALGLAMLKTLADIERLDYHRPSGAVIHTLLKMRGPLEAFLREVEAPTIYSLYFNDDNNELWITFEKNGKPEKLQLE